MQRQILFNEFRWDAIQKQGRAEGRDFLMIAEEIHALREELDENLSANLFAIEEANEEIKRLTDEFVENEELHSKNTELTNQLGDSAGEIAALQAEVERLRLELQSVATDRDAANLDKNKLLATIAAMELKEMLS